MTEREGFDAMRMRPLRQEAIARLSRQGLADGPLTRRPFKDVVVDPEARTDLADAARFKSRLGPQPMIDGGCAHPATARSSPGDGKKQKAERIGAA
jgi:hypothetical protein